MLLRSVAIATLLKAATLALRCSKRVETNGAVQGAQGECEATAFCVQVTLVSACLVHNISPNALLFFVVCYELMHCFQWQVHYDSTVIFTCSHRESVGSHFITSRHLYSPSRRLSHCRQHDSCDVINFGSELSPDQTFIVTCEEQECIDFVNQTTVEHTLCCCHSGDNCANDVA